MSDSFEPRIGQTDQLYTRFEQNLALTWAHAHFAEFLRANPDCSFEEQEICFLNAVESGLSLALDLRDRGY